MQASNSDQQLGVASEASEVVRPPGTRYACLHCKQVHSARPSCVKQQLQTARQQPTALPKCMHQRIRPAAGHPPCPAHLKGEVRKRAARRSAAVSWLTKHSCSLMCSRRYVSSIMFTLLQTMRCATASQRCRHQNPRLRTRKRPTLCGAHGNHQISKYRTCLYDTSSFMKLVSALPPRSMRRMAAGSTRQSNTGTCAWEGGTGRRRGRFSDVRGRQSSQRVPPGAAPAGPCRHPAAAVVCLAVPHTRREHQRPARQQARAPRV